MQLKYLDQKCKIRSKCNAMETPTFKKAPGSSFFDPMQIVIFFLSKQSFFGPIRRSTVVLVPRVAKTSLELRKLAYHTSSYKNQFSECILLVVQFYHVSRMKHGHHQFYLHPTLFFAKKHNLTRWATVEQFLITAQLPQDLIHPVLKFIKDLQT